MPTQQAQLGRASATYIAKILQVSTGKTVWRWRLTERGFASTKAADCDWSLPGILPEGASGKLLTLTITPSDDEGFTSKHLAIEAIFDYGPIQLKYVIWAYPDAPGIRTQLWLRGTVSPVAAGSQEEHTAIVEIAVARRRYIGYYNDTQHRNLASTPLLRDEVLTGTGSETVPWASAAGLESERGVGLLLVQESHKCVNQRGVNTGAFVFDGKSLMCSGLRLAPADITPDRWRECWAVWTIQYDGQIPLSRALKHFARLRYPSDPKRDFYAQANTWGSGGSNGIDSKAMAHEDVVLKELDSVADLGLDALQIDDGWQGNQTQGNHWRPDPMLYPQGWKNVVAKAKEKNITLNLWAASMKISSEDLRWNFEQAYFRSWKLDFASLKTPDQIEQNIAKVRQFILSTKHQTRATWDVTENASRYGYFWAREYGGVWRVQVIKVVR
ncbi:hypothetical protein [Armatimonas sp.]|uniref:hypothetical protein n=1 Tax=Armatimonas sp. TaxID=1872638 RepID=UPI00286BB6C1|nr:hypothetical protein [Armatimonas sp.]